LVFVENTNKERPDTITIEIEKKKTITPIASLKPSKDSSLATTAPSAVAHDTVKTVTMSQLSKPKDGPDTAKANVQVSKASPIVVCDRPIADYKDIRALQKKLLGIASDEEQRNYAVKAFGLKCFNSKQALEIGWFFLDENSRLQLFKALKPLISDKASFGNLEVSFLKEENIMAFRALVAGTN